MGGETESETVERGKIALQRLAEAQACRRSAASLRRNAGGFAACPGADGIVAMPARQRGLAAPRGVEQVERFGLVLAQRRRRDVAVAPAVRIGFYGVLDRAEAPVDRPIAAQLARRVTCQPRIERQRALDRQAGAAV